MFKEIEIESLCFNPFTKIGDEWALLTAGNEKDGFNMMTAGWADFGRFWSKYVVTAYVRESRYTRRFFDNHDLFTVSFYGEQYRNALNICGTLHGNECDKVAKSGLTPCFIDGTAAFEEADLIYVCRKMFHADVTPDGVDDMAVFKSVYPTPDYHRLYIGEVVKILGK